MSETTPTPGARAYTALTEYAETVTELTGLACAGTITIHEYVRREQAARAERDRALEVEARPPRSP